MTPWGGRAMHDFCREPSSCYKAVKIAAVGTKLVRDRTTAYQGRTQDLKLVGAWVKTSSSLARRQINILIKKINILIILGRGGF